MTPRRVIVDLIASLKIWWRNKGAVFWTLLFPILLILIFGYIFSGSYAKATLYVQDLDATPISQDFTESLEKTNILDIKSLSLNENLDNYIEENRIKAVLVIPKGFQQFIINSTTDPNSGRTINLTLKLDQSEEQTNSLVYAALESVLHQYNMQLSGGRDLIGIKQENLILERYEYIDFFVPGIVGMTIMTSCIYGSISVNTRYRKDGIIRKLLTTPISRFEWIATKILYQIVLAFISASVIIIVGVAVFGVKVSINGWVFAAIVFASTTFAGIGMIIARFVRDEETAEAAGSAVSFPMMFLSGTFFPLEIMPIELQYVAKVLPLYYVNEATRGAMILGSRIDILSNNLVVLAMGIGVFFIGVALTKWKED